MCFSSTKYAKRKTAKTDIECWKLLKSGRGYKSNYRKFSYKKGVINPLVELIKDYNYNIHHGYHSYRSKDMAEMSFIPRVHKLCKFIIPAGSHYYANVWEYVSEQIMLVK
jgi:hypothetical protein